MILCKGCNISARLKTEEEMAIWVRAHWDHEGDWVIP